MLRDFAFILIFAAVCSATSGKRWRSHHSHKHDCRHHHHDWNNEAGNPSWDYDGWQNDNEYDNHGHHSWGWDDHHRHHPHYPNYDWGNTDDSGWTADQERTTPWPSTTYPNVRTEVSPNSEAPTDTTVFPTPTSAPPTTISPSPSPLSSQLSDLQTCLAACPVTTEYDPVCGTNYETYSNMGRFLCAQGCGVDVKIFLRRSCPSLGVGVGRITTVQCVASCTITEENNPVCGSDGITYDNPSQLLCAQMCGYNVMLKSMSSCSEGAIQTTPKGYLSRTPAVAYGVRLCIQNCPTSPETRPVCGTNGVTYQNPSYLECEKLCGIEVEIKQRAACGQPVNTNNPPMIGIEEQRVNPLSLTEQTCVQSCPMTTEFRPVCGTNDITYNNPSQLTCDQSCGIRVTIKQHSPCPPNTNNNQVTSTEPTLTTPATEACISSCPRTHEFNPVCGTNGITYNNEGHLMCAQFCGVRVDIQRRSPCPNPVVQEASTIRQPERPIINPSLPVTMSTEPNIGGSNTVDGPNNGVTQDVTISPDVLQSIFLTTTEPDEDLGLDERYGQES